MSGQLRALKNRIRGVESTQKITRAMEMVAAAKLKRYQRLHEQSLPYAQALEGILERLLHEEIAVHHPLLEARKEKRAALLVITSDTGLCGSFNQNILETTRKFLATLPQEPLLIGAGKTGVNALSRAGYKCYQDFADTKAIPLDFMITEIGLLLEELFVEKKVDEVYVVSTRLTRHFDCQTKAEKILPLRLRASEAPFPSQDFYITEPSREALLGRMIPLVFGAQVRTLFMESLVAEQLARMNAMHQATENAEELMETLVLLRNKIRQAAITRELIEIVSGSKALKN